MIEQCKSPNCFWGWTIAQAEKANSNETQKNELYVNAPHNS